MLDFIYRKTEQAATLQIFGLLFILFIFCTIGFQWRHEKLGQQINVFDARFRYSPQEAKQLLDELGDNGRRTYAITQMTLDLLFPFVYGGLIVILFYAYGVPRYFLLIPLITVAADLLENITTTYLALSYKGLESPIAHIASAFTTVKRIGLYLSVAIILSGIVVFIWRRFK